MPQGQVENVAFADFVNVEHRMAGILPFVFHKALRRTAVLRIQQNMQVAVGLHQIELVRAFERLDALDKGVIGVRHFHLVGLDGWVSPEHGTQGLHEQRRPVRRAETAIGHQANNGIGPVQGVPAPTVGDPGTQLLLGGQGRDHVTGVGDNEIRLADGVDILEVLEDANPEAIVFRQEFQDLQPGEINVVPDTARDQNTVDASGSFLVYAHTYPLFYLQYPTSAALAEHLLTGVTDRSTPADTPRESASRRFSRSGCPLL